MVSMFALTVVDLGFEQSVQTKDYKTGICFFSAKNAALRSKYKDWLAQKKDNISEYLATFLPPDCCSSKQVL